MLPRLTIRLQDLYRPKLNFLSDELVGPLLVLKRLHDLRARVVSQVDNADSIEIRRIYL